MLFSIKFYFSTPRQKVNILAEIKHKIENKDILRTNRKKGQFCRFIPGISILKYTVEISFFDTVRRPVVLDLPQSQKQHFQRQKQQGENDEPSPEYNAALLFIHHLAEIGLDIGGEHLHVVG